MTTREAFMRQMGLTASDLASPPEEPSRSKTTEAPQIKTNRAATTQSKADFLKSLGIDNYEDSFARGLSSTDRKNPPVTAARNATGSQEFPNVDSTRRVPDTKSKIEYDDDESSFRGSYTPKFREPQQSDITLGRKTSERLQTNTPLDSELQNLCDSAGAEEVKTMGNKFFQSGDYRKAVRLYSRAIELDSSNAALYSNRSAAYLLGGKQMGIDTRSMALRDADKTIKLKPTWFKGYSRRGDALFKLERYQEAEQAYQDALNLEPGNAGILHSLNELKPFIPKKSSDSTLWTAPGNAILYSSVSSEIPKSTDKSAHQLLDEFEEQRSRTNPQLGRGGSDYKQRELEKRRSRVSTQETSLNSTTLSETAFTSQQSPLAKRDVPAEFSSDAARDYQAALLEAYRKKKSQNGPL